MHLNLLLIASIAASVWAKTPDNVTSRLLIHIPHSLSKEGGYDHREALFGIPPYGASIAQNVYYAESDLCDPIVDTSIGVPSRKKGENGKMEPWPSPFILMVDRGSCTFVKKVRNAQRSGAAAVIIADTTCLCYDDQCVKSSGTQGCESAEPIMADDGSGGDISIPSFLMFKRDADAVKEELKQDHPVQLEMSWSLPNPDDRVEYDLWSVPSDPVSLDFFKSFKTAVVALGSHAYFTPHMYVYDGIRSHCLGNDGHNMCYNLCTNNGRYCATDPDNDLEKGISGADVVRESLRRICIWKYYGEKDGIGEKWWEYVSKFNELCNTASYFMNDDCVKDAYRKAGIDGDIVARCMNDSGGLISDKSNALLDAEIHAQNERGVVVLPTAFVNSAALRGALSFSNVFAAICAGYATGTAPKICQQCASCSKQQVCVEAGGTCPAQPGQKVGGSVSTHTFLFSLLLVTGLFAGLGAWHYKRTREEMREQVRGILAEYMPLEDHEDGGSPMDFARRGASTSLIS